VEHDQITGGKNLFSLDVESVAKEGVEEWSAGFKWPVSFQDEKQAFLDTINALRDIYLGLDRDMQDLFLINIGLFVVYYPHIINAAQVLEGLKKDNLEPVFSEDRDFYDTFLPGQAPASNYFDARSARPPKRHIIKKFLKERLYNVKCNTLFSRDDYLSIGSICFLKEEFIKKNPSRIQCKFCSESPESLFNFKEEVDAATLNAIKEASSAIADVITGLLKKHSNGLFGTEYRKVFYEKTYTTMLESAKLYKGGLRIAKEDLKKVRGMLLTGLGNRYNRIAALLAHRNGVDVIGAIHGNSTGIDQNFSYYFIDLLMANTYLVPTRNAKNNFEALKKKYSYFGESKAEIVSVDSPFYKNLSISLDRKKAKRAPAAPETIMYIETPANYRRDYFFPTIHFFTQLDFSIRLFKLIRAQGTHKIAIKVHPDTYRKGVTEKLYGGLVDRIIKEPFEKVYDEADTYIFSTIGTTTLSFALLTDKKIISFDMLDDEWVADGVSALKKRCHFINARFDGRNRMVFEEKEFLDALNLKEDRVNTEFIERYMFPA
jgi:hypothetical protein